jgi:hypothetical protein
LLLWPNASCANRSGYTWERYQIEYDGASLCLKCAAERYFADQDHWLDPREVKEVVLKPGAPLFDRATGTLNLPACRHVLGVSQPLPAGIKLLENAEFDSGSGHQISGRKVTAPHIKAESLSRTGIDM